MPRLLFGVLQRDNGFHTFIPTWPGGNVQHVPLQAQVHSRVRSEVPMLQHQVLKTHIKETAAKCQDQLETQTGTNRKNNHASHAESGCISKWQYTFSDRGTNAITATRRGTASGQHTSTRRTRRRNLSAPTAAGRITASTTTRSQGST